MAARVAASWAVAASTSMDARLDATLRAILMEGAFGKPFGSWSNKMNPMQAVENGIEPDVARQLRESGWFTRPGTSGYINMYRYLTEGAIRLAKQYGMGDAQGEDAVAELMAKPGRQPGQDGQVLKSNARSAGELLANDLMKGEVPVRRAFALLTKMVRRRVQDIAKQRKQDETRREGPSRDDEGKERSPLDQLQSDDEKPTINEVVRASFHDPHDPLGKFIRSEMRQTFEDAYGGRAQRRAPSENGRARAEKPPMLHLLDKMEDPENHVVVDGPDGPVRRLVIPKLRDVADDLGVARSTVKQRHALPMLMKFTERLRTDPKIKSTIAKELDRRGYSREDIQEFFDRPNPFGVTSVTHGSPTIKIVDPQYRDED